jgi:hypothetical protein
VGVVFRRGPSKQVGCFYWDRASDQFRVGQWLHGRIYERRSDLSPDGKYLLYFAMNGKWDSATGGSWTAVSRAPWLKALALYAKGDCWEGGGLFLGKNKFWLNDRYFSAKRILQESTELIRVAGYAPPQTYNAEDTGVYYVRLQRDGWKLIEHRNSNQLDAVALFEKPLPNGWVLRKIAHEQVGAPPGKGCYWDEHELVNRHGVVTAQPTWEWAELDRDRLIWAERGCLFQALSLNGDTIGAGKLLYDFTAHGFEPIEAPY